MLGHQVDMATLDNRAACENWRAKDRLRSSLLALFPAALVGQVVRVTLLDDSQVTGRLESCDGMLNLVLTGGVLVTPANTSKDRIEPITLEEITIFGKRARYVSVPGDLDVHKTPREWDFDLSSGRSALPVDKRLLSRPKRAKDKYAYLRPNRRRSGHTGQHIEGSNRTDHTGAPYRNRALSVVSHTSLCALQEITIFGKRVRYVSVPGNLDVHKTLREWDFDLASGRSALPVDKRLLSRPKRAKDKYAYLRPDSETAQSSDAVSSNNHQQCGNESASGTTGTHKSIPDEVLRLPSFTCDALGMKLIGDPDTDRALLSTLYSIFDEKTSD
ncbi:unnamed protein product [Echinostoma caproni]|uniref:Sm domain-containing protein n=1 Tax=Echinostoma caproni TaxID=27848 RepID=A0A183AUD1_9TREM|nr:unnamed protein product [Echinostoma caproni]